MSRESWVGVLPTACMSSTSGVEMRPSGRTGTVPRIRLTPSDWTADTTGPAQASVKNPDTIDPSTVTVG